MLILKGVDQLVNDDGVEQLSGGLLADEEHVTHRIVVADGLLEQELDQQTPQVDRVGNQAEALVSLGQVLQRIARVLRIEPFQQVRLERFATGSANRGHLPRFEPRERFDLRKQLRHPRFQSSVAPPLVLTARITSAGGRRHYDRQRHQREPRTLAAASHGAYSAQASGSCLTRTRTRRNPGPYSLVISRLSRW